MPAPYPPEFRQRAVELARDADKPVAESARDIEISETCLRNWLNQADIDEGRRRACRRRRKRSWPGFVKRTVCCGWSVICSLEPQPFRLGECLPEVIFRFMDANKADFPIRFIADRLDVSTSGFYEWRHRQSNPCQRDIADADLTEIICEIHERSRGTYGSPRAWADLRLGSGIRVGRKRVERLMRQAGIAGVTRRRRTWTTRRDPHAQPSDDLVNRVFAVDGPDRLWVAVITEHPTLEGKVYLAAVLDAWNRECIGWSITDHLKAEMVSDAFDMATWRRRPDPASGLIHHADHGTQYTSWVFGQRLREAGILGSMGTVGDALDNAMAESFFATLQVELLDRRTWTTRAELAQAIFEYIEGFYNPERRHSRLDYHSPVQYRQRHHTAISEVA